MGRSTLPVSLYRHTFRHRRGRLYCEGVSVERIAEAVGTPVYIYSKKTILEHYRKLRKSLAALNPLICFSVKSNSNLAVLKTLARNQLASALTILRKRLDSIFCVVVVPRHTVVVHEFK